MTEKKKSKKSTTGGKTMATKKVAKWQTKDWLVKNYPKKSAGAIAREQGTSRGAVLNQLRKYKIKITTRTSSKAGQRKSNVDRSYHKAAYLTKQLKAGLTVHGIAKQCGCGYMQVFHMVEKHGLVELAQEMKKKAAAKKPAAKKPEKKKTVAKKKTATKKATGKGEVKKASRPAAKKARKK